MSKPSELAITLATGGHRYEVSPGWVYASQIAANLRLFGFDDVNGRRLASTLTRMCTADAPWLERRRSPFDDHEYRVTQYGRTDVHNRLARVHVAVP